MRKKHAPPPKLKPLKIASVVWDVALSTLHTRLQLHVNETEKPIAIATVISARVGMSLGAKISGGRGRPLGIFFGLYKTRHFAIRQCKLHRATYRRCDTIPACDRRTDRQTDGQTDGIAIVSTALAMRALRHAVTNWFERVEHNDSLRCTQLDRTVLVVFS